jgi:tetratricopeptide (TPR) repeat protein
LSQTLNVRWNAALALALARQDQRVLSIADDIQRDRPNDTIAQNVAVPTIRASAYLWPGKAGKANPDKAIDQLNTALVYMRASPGTLFTRGYAYALAKRYSEAEQDYQQVLNLRIARGPDMVTALAQVELGRLYQKQGDFPKARIAYQNFFTMWKDADPDVPLLLQAKAEYAKVQ